MPPRKAVAAKAELPDYIRPAQGAPNKVQIGPRIDPDIHADFIEYVNSLALAGFKQSQIVEWALQEFMARYPVKALLDQWGTPSRRRSNGRTHRE